MALTTNNICGRCGIACVEVEGQKRPPLSEKFREYQEAAESIPELELIIRSQRSTIAALERELAEAKADCVIPHQRLAVHRYRGARSACPVCGSGDWSCGH